MKPDKRRIVLDLELRPDMRTVLNRLHEKTGIESAPNLILLALVNYDALLKPEPPGVLQPDNSARPRRSIRFDGRPD